MARIFFRDTFQPTDRPPYKELPLPVAAYFPEYIAVSEVVEYVNIVFLHGSFHNAISAILPDIVVGAYASQAFFPEPCPLGPVVIKEMNRIVLRVFRNQGSMVCRLLSRVSTQRSKYWDISSTQCQPTPISLPKSGSQA